MPRLPKAPAISPQALGCIRSPKIILTSMKLKQLIRESKFAASRESATWLASFSRVSQGPQTLPTRLLAPLEPLRFSTVPLSPTPLPQSSTGVLKPTRLCQRSLESFCKWCWC